MRSVFARLLVAALAGLATALAFEPFALAYLAPVGVAALTVVCVGVRPRRGFLLGVVYGSAFMLALLPWVQVIGAYAWVPLALIEGLFYGLAGLVTAAVVRLRWWPLWAACAWVALELLRGTVPFGGFPWGRLAFATVDTPVAPLFAYVGAAGVSFVVALVGTALAWAVLALRRTPVRALAAVGAASVVALAAAPFDVNAASTAPALRRVTVASVQGNVPGVGMEAFAERRAVLDNHVAATEALAARVAAGKTPRPDLVVWPENSSDIDPYTDPLARASIAGAVRAMGVPLLMGAVVGDRAEEGWYNRMIVWSRKGRPGAFYNKRHPVPFGEYIPMRALLEPRIPALQQIPSDMIQGKRPGVLQVGPAQVGVVNCFEVAYDSMVRDVVRGGAQIIAVPTNNATYTGTGQIEQQFAMSRLRAIETGRYVVVASTNGISGLIAPDGSVVQRAPVRTQAVLQARLALTTRVTPGVRVGGGVELVLVGAGGVALLVGLWRGRRRRATDDAPPATEAPRAAEPVSTR